MSHESDIYSWDVKQDDLSGQSVCGADSKFSTANAYNYYRHRPCIGISNSDVGFINPSTYIASERPNEVSEYRPINEANYGDSASLANHFSSLSINGDADDVDFAGDQKIGRNTYRCQASTSTNTALTTSSRHNPTSSVRIVSCDLRKNFDQESNVVSDEPEVQRYAVNGHRVVEFSSRSVSCINLSDSQESSSRLQNEGKTAFEEWAAKKRNAALRRKEEARRLEEEKQLELKRLAREREERERRERENFLQWVDRKRREGASKREAIERQLVLKRLKEVEEKTDMIKTIHHRQWVRKKEEQQKALQKKRDLIQKRIDEDRKKRLEESSKAYEKWRETSKNKPRPVTQGLLPSHKVIPSYINPNPWVVDDVQLTETSKNQPPTIARKDDGKKRTKSNVTKKIAS